MSITNNTVKKKVFEISEKHTNTDKIKEVILDTKKDFKDVYQFKKSVVIEEGCRPSQRDRKNKSAKHRLSLIQR